MQTRNIISAKAHADPNIFVCHVHVCYMHKVCDYPIPEPPSVPAEPTSSPNVPHLNAGGDHQTRRVQEVGLKAVHDAGESGVVPCEAHERPNRYCVGSGHPYSFDPVEAQLVHTTLSDMLLTDARWTLMAEKPGTWLVRSQERYCTLASATGP